MKRIILLFALSFCTCFLMQAQVMHSSSAMEYSLGVEGFSSFVAKQAELSGQISPLRPTQFRARPILTGRYKKSREEGDYFAFGMKIGWTSWGESVSIRPSSDFIIIEGNASFEDVFERNDEGVIGISYQYSFLINKKAKKNFQFFVGANAAFNYDFASKDITSVFFTPTLTRNIIGGRISVLPELTYLVPNSRITLSLRAIVPLFDMQSIREDLRQSTFSSFSRVVTVSSDYSFAPLNRSGVEIGFGYFLKSNK